MVGSEKNKADFKGGEQTEIKRGVGEARVKCRNSQKFEENMETKIS